MANSANVGKSSATINETAKAVGKKTYQGIADALLGVTKSEWTLADAYASEVAPGMTAVKQADYDAMASWLEKNKSRVPAYNTMRTVRSVAVFWPQSARIPGVGFSIHRELMTGNKTYRQALTMAKAIAAKKGKGTPLTAIKVDAIRVHNGKATVSANAKGKGKQAQAGTNAVPVIPVSQDANGIASGIRTAASQLTRAKIADLTNDELEGLSARIAELAKRLQSETAKRAKASKAEFAAKQTAKAEHAAKVKAERISSSKSVKPATTTTTKPVTRTRKSVR
jgi:hypothetical protein